MTTKQPLIIAHRGAAGEAPENTLAAFRLALAQGCDGFELDVHLSKDGHIVVIHDETLERTTNGKGYVKEMTLAQLQQVDAGSERYDDQCRNEGRYWERSGGSARSAFAKNQSYSLCRRIFF